MRFLESIVSLALIIAAVALVSVYFARGRELPFKLFEQGEPIDNAVDQVASSFDPPTPSIWAEKIRELEAQKPFFGFFAVPTDAGTAFYIDEAGTLLTAAHVVSGPGPYLLERFGGRDLFRVSVLDVDFEQDLALLEPEVPLATVIAREGGALPIFDLSVDSPTVGETVWALCAAPAEQARVIEMRVTRIHAAAIVTNGQHEARLNDTIILDDGGSSHGGCSGGPIVNERGVAVGMLNGGRDGFVIASSTDSIRAWTELTRAAADRATPSVEDATSTAQPAATPSPAPTSESVVSIALLTQPVTGICSPDQLQAADEALANTQRSQRTHIDWIEYLQTYPDFDTADIGSQDFHQEFVQEYQIVIDTLTTQDEECRNLAGPSITLSALVDPDRGLCSQEQLKRVDDAGGIVRRAQRTHQEWVDFLMDIPDHDTSLVGSPEHHRRLVQDYQLLIDVSTTMSDGCNSLLEAGSQ